MSDRNRLQSNYSQNAPGFNPLRRESDVCYHNDAAHDYSDLPKSLHNYKGPPKIQPPKSKFYTLYEEDLKHGDSGKVNIQITPVPNEAQPGSQKHEVSIGNILAYPKLSGEILRERYSSDKDWKQRFNQAQPHGSIESNPSSDAQVKLFDKAHQTSLLVPRRSSVSLPVSPNSSPKLEKKVWLPRQLSASNLLQIATMGVAHTSVPRSEDSSLVAADKANQIVKSEPASKTVSAISNTKVKDETDSVDIQSSSSLSNLGSGFGNWLFKKKITIDNKDMNVMFPSSS